MMRMAIIRMMANGKFWNRYFMDWSLAIFLLAIPVNNLRVMVCFLSVPRWQDVLFRFNAGCGRTLCPLASLPVVTGNYRIFPPDINLFADLFQRCTSHDAFHQIFFRKCAGFQLHHGFLVQQSVQGRQRREDLCVAQVLYRFSFLVEAFQVDVVLWIPS